MGNRMLKESIRTSRTVNAMTDFQFRVWAYLITYVDDYGCGSADPELLKGLVFPRRKRLSESDIKDALDGLAGMGCIHLYDVDGESYFCFPNWGEHQRVQAKKRKFPEPPKLNGKSRKVTVSHGEPPPETKPSRNQGEVAPARNDHDDKIVCAAVKLSQSMDALEAQWKKMGNSVEQTDLEAMEQLLIEDDVDTVLDAMKAAADNGVKHSWPYIRKTLENWRKNGRTKRTAEGGAPDVWASCPPL